MKPRPTYITVASSHNAVGWVPSGSLRSPTLGRGDTLAVWAQEPLVGFQFFGSALNKL